MRHSPLYRRTFPSARPCNYTNCNSWVLRSLPLVLLSLSYLRQSNGHCSQHPKNLFSQNHYDLNSISVLNSVCIYVFLNWGQPARLRNEPVIIKAMIDDPSGLAVGGTLLDDDMHFASPGQMRHVPAFAPSRGELMPGLPNLPQPSTPRALRQQRRPQSLRFGVDRVSEDHLVT
jgi:hypothetical protein